MKPNKVFSLLPHGLKDVNKYIKCLNEEYTVFLRPINVCEYSYIEVKVKLLTSKCDRI